MSTYLSDRVQSINPSPSIAANTLAQELKRQGRDIVNLTVGEPDFDTPAHIIEAAAQAMQKGDTHYTATPGTLALRQAIITKLQRDNGLEYTADEIVVGCGGKHVIFHAFAATLNPGDEVIIHAPYWVSYPDLAVLHEAKPIVIKGQQANGFKLLPAELEAFITAKTKWVVINYPNNPTGAVYTEDELRALAAVLERYPSILVMADEIYEHFVFGVKHQSLLKVAPQLKKRLLIINGASKGYAMTGWRIGFGAGPQPLIQAMSKLLSQSTTCPSSISQAGAVAAFAGTQEPIATMAATYARRRDLMLEHLEGIEGVSYCKPDGAFYVYLNVENLLGKAAPGGKVLNNDQDVAEHCLMAAGVATVCGAAYGLSPYLRLSFASDEQSIIEGCARVRNAVQMLK
ncbi:MAG TPA: pyridoxal phosphate-dependent aminotransferase [Pseudomonas sp.]|uniref:pyridoxal phosphate-dependent aminotransferase n=1 Tax=Pseudomonas sp. TaxID=306 RepID=UPI002EDAF184